MPPVELTDGAAPPEVKHEIRRLFSDFMATVTKFEDLVSAGKQLVPTYHQELELLRQPPLQSSGIVSEIIKSNYTDRMKSYLEAGWRHSQQNFQNINGLHVCEQGLQEYLTKAKVLMEEIERLADEAYNFILATNRSSATNVGDDLVEQAYMEEGETGAAQSDDHCSFSTVTIMMLIRNMLKLDYTMQERIIQSLNLATASSVLETYDLMWGLRPYIDDKIMQLAWKHYV